MALAPGTVEEGVEAEAEPMKATAAWPGIGGVGGCGGMEAEAGPMMATAAWLGIGGVGGCGGAGVLSAKRVATLKGVVALGDLVTSGGVGGSGL